MCTGKYSFTKKSTDRSTTIYSWCSLSFIFERSLGRWRPRYCRHFVEHGLIPVGVPRTGSSALLRLVARYSSSSRHLLCLQSVKPLRRYLGFRYKSILIGLPSVIMVKGKLQIPRSGANKKISAANKHSTASLAVHIFQLLKPTATAVPSYTTCGTVVTDDR